MEETDFQEETTSKTKERKERREEIGFELETQQNTQQISTVGGCYNTNNPQPLAKSIKNSVTNIDFRFEFFTIFDNY